MGQRSQQADFQREKFNSKDKKDTVASFKSHFGALFNILDENSCHQMNHLNTESRTVYSGTCNCASAFLINSVLTGFPSVES